MWFYLVRKVYFALQINKTIHYFSKNTNCKTLFAKTNILNVNKIKNCENYIDNIGEKVQNNALTGYVAQLVRARHS